MTTINDFSELNIDIDQDVAVMEINRPPHNFFDFELISQLSSACDALGERSDCRAIVLCSAGKSFCAGANFGDGSGTQHTRDRNTAHLYEEAVRIFSSRKPIIAAVQGAAIGGGLGLAISADFRVTCPEGRFAANFTRLGFHPGFGLTTTLPELIGRQKASMVFYTSRRFKGEEAVEMGMADMLVPLADVRATAIELAREIATNAPLAVVATRDTLRAGLAERVAAATAHELKQQQWLQATEDFREGVKATSERRVPNSQGR